MNLLEYLLTFLFKVTTHSNESKVMNIIF